MEYEILSEKGTEPLADVVKEYIANGWKPLGGAFVLKIIIPKGQQGQNAWPYLFFQTMIKE